MTEIQTTEAVQTEPGTRAFYRSDYGRFSRAVRRARQVQGDRYTAKPDAQHDTVSALAVLLVQVFEADSPHFDAQRFIGSTQLQQAPEFVPAEDGHLEAEYENASSGE